jgi:thioesterase domain-containing protein
MYYMAVLRLFTRGRLVPVVVQSPEAIYRVPTLGKVAQVQALMQSELDFDQAQMKADPDRATPLKGVLGTQQIEPSAHSSLEHRQSELPDIGELKKAVGFATATWPGPRAAPGSLIKEIRTGKSDKQLFWCTNGINEFLPVVPHIDDSLSLYAMRSSFGLSHADYGEIRALASIYVDDLIRIKPTGPYHLAGYCLGGLVALEMARELSLRSRSIDALLLVELDTRNKYRSVLLWGVHRIAKVRLDWNRLYELNPHVKKRSVVQNICRNAIYESFKEIKNYFQYFNKRNNDPDTKTPSLSFHPYSGDAILIFGAESYLGLTARIISFISRQPLGSWFVDKLYHRTNLIKNAEFRLISGGHWPYFDEKSCKELGEEINKHILQVDNK